MNNFSYTTDTMQYLNTALTAYHASAESQRLLIEAGFQPLSVRDDWQLVPGGRYVVATDDGTTIAFVVPEASATNFSIICTHNDSPALRLKPTPEWKRGGYTMLNAEVYGGPILTSWFDRPLAIAGRAFTRGEDWLHPQQHLITLDSTVTIPSLAIHMKRTPGDIDPQKELIALWSASKEAPTIRAAIAQQLDVPEEDVLSHELYLVSAEKAYIHGASDEFYTSSRIDNLANACAATFALAAAQPVQSISVFLSYQHEEIGSRTREGAASQILDQLLARIAQALDLDVAVLKQESIILSCDQAHAAHPNYLDKADPVLHPRLGDGPVLKLAAAHTYATTARGEAMFRALCETHQLPYQVFVNHSSARGGSTIGPIAETATGLESIDVGNAMLAMHAICETASLKDQETMRQLMQFFYEQ